MFKVTRLKFRLAEMILTPLMLVMIDGVFHVAENRPFVNDFLFGGATAAFLLRGLDALRAAERQWPEV